MYQLNFTVRTLAPVVISLKYGEINTINTERYIPGTTILGMLAWRYLQQKKANGNSIGLDEDFLHFFLDGGVIFTNGWFTRKNEYDEDAIYYPAPVSFRKSKTNEEEIYNILFTEDDFDEQTQAIESFISEEEMKQTLPVLELHHHHQRDRSTGAPAKGELFTYEAISPNQFFQGKMIGEEKYIQKLMDICGRQWTGWIGRSRNSQYGKVEFTLESPEKMGSFQNIEDEQIILTMLSHTLIHNEHGFSTLDINKLERYLYGAEIIKAAIKTRIIENFVGVWGFKKPSEMGFQAGSSFLLDIKDADREKLSGLQSTGLGERTHEGFGQIRLDSVPNELGPLYFLWYAPENQPEKPKIDLPDCAKSIVKEIVDKEIHNKIRCLAAEELIKFQDTGLAGGSLIARIEGFLNSRKNNIAGFREDINALKDIARNQLERCRSDDMTMKSFLLKNYNALEIEMIMNRGDMQTVQSICDAIDYKPEFEVDSLTLIFFKKFVSLMKKRIKSLQKEK